MSAIVGIHRPDGQPVERGELESMLATVVHRGPHGAGVWTKGSTGLGHRLLHSTPESLQEHLPLVSTAAELTVTADARIDNRDELIRALHLTGRPAGDIVDAELILAAYERWGDECPDRLFGDFAFAIWDGRRRTLFCARDRFGVKPFYYYASPGRAFVFGSEIKPILCVTDVPRRLNEAAIADYLIDSFLELSATFYEGVLRLLPGHSLSVGASGVRVSRYYHGLAPTGEERSGSPEDNAAALREIFTEAVRCRLRTAFPVGVTLSGGLDSTSVACVARNLLVENGQDRLSTFSAVFDEIVECDERRYIDAVVGTGGFEPHRVIADRLEVLRDFERVLSDEEEPGRGLYMVLSRTLFTAAQQSGVPILLDGHDGDGAISNGYGYLDELAQARRWPTLARELWALHRALGVPYWGPLRSYGRLYAFDPLLGRIRQLGVVRPARSIRRRLRAGRRDAGGRPDPPPEHAYLSPEFARRLAVGERYRSWRQSRRWPRTEREAHYQIITDGIQMQALEELDRVAGALSVELRHPFFDHRLVEFCLSLPAKQKLHQGWTRLIMRNAMEGILPSEVQWRSAKTDFTPAFSRSLLVLQREALLHLLESPGAERDYLDLARLRDTYRKLSFAPRGKATGGVVFPIWKALRLALWLRSAAPGGISQQEHRQERRWDFGREQETLRAANIERPR
jgi:asparagine synthase (glutamine-hydrolysing)